MSEQETYEKGAHTYKIIEEKEDPKESVIEKTGIKATFTVYEMETEDLQLAKYLKELSGQKMLSDAKITNIENHHPWVKDLTPEQLITAHLYQEAIAMSRVLGPKIDSIKAGIVESAEEKIEIEKQLGIPLSIKELNKETPNGESTNKTE